MAASSPDSDPHDPPLPMPPAAPVVQSTSGGISLGACNQIEQIGDLVAGDKISIVVYTGPASPENAAQRAGLERAYRSEIAARYTVWKTRYAPLTIQSTGPRADDPLPRYEREELVFAALRRMVENEAPASTTDRPPDTPPPEPTTFTDLRDGLERYGDLLLLGPPGGGKTTALWRLALDLAEAGLHSDTSAALPSFVRLGGLKQAQSLIELLQSELTGAALTDTAGRQFPLPAHRALAPLLPMLLDSGRLVLLWDGLNEVPQSLFAHAASELDVFRRAHPGPLPGPRAHSVTTCRADDYALLVEQCDGNDPLPIQQATVQGLDQATIRQIILGRLGPASGPALLNALAEPRQRALAALARTPLLLTMLCEVYAATGGMPANRGKLLQAFVAQRWEWERQRHPDTWIDSTLQEQGLARLAYAMTGSQAVGTVMLWPLARQHLAVRAVSPELLRTLASRADFLEILDGGQSVRFSHQLIQEYFAARALQTKLSTAARLRQTPLLGWLGQRLLQRYAAPGHRTGWEETLLLLAGIEGEGSLARELVRAFLSRPLEAARLLLASGEEGDPALLEEVRQVLLAVMVDTHRSVRERIEVGHMLGQLSDPRFPTTIDQWQSEPFRQAFGHPPGYWCYVRPGTYLIGGWEQSAPSANIALAAFWIARFPITIAQYAPFVEQGYEEGAERWWTPNG